MAHPSYMLIFALLISVFGAGWCLCDLSSIKVTQNGTGDFVQSRPEYEVTVSNDCVCSQERVRFESAGFQSVEAVDPKIFRRDGQSFLLNDGRPFSGFDTITFNYAWETQFAISPVQSQIACS
ncbi:hypothetical protein H6P81_020607 [Aristolochia fimbriata]|uniref:Uncharacterized protein n=1 Tax=Aristolochia fimbriata TaxID=158543 RepID=A0AAV7DZA2_ARIFI|nr:hypothetical protein H6P81_020607 [Aristolochia fimbriata]